MSETNTPKQLKKSGFLSKLLGKRPSVYSTGNTSEPNLPKSSSKNSLNEATITSRKSKIGSSPAGSLHSLEKKWSVKHRDSSRSKKSSVSSPVSGSLNNSVGNTSKSLDKLDEIDVLPVGKASPSTAVQASVLKERVSMINGSFPVTLAGGSGSVDICSSPLNMEFQSPGTFENDGLKLVQSKDDGDYRQVLQDEYIRMTEKASQLAVNPQEEPEKEQAAGLAPLKIEVPVVKAPGPGATRPELAQQIRARSKSSARGTPPGIETFHQMQSSSIQASGSYSATGMSGARKSEARSISGARMSEARSISGARKSSVARPSSSGGRSSNERDRSDSTNSYMSMYQAANITRTGSQVSSKETSSPDDIIERLKSGMNSRVKVKPPGSRVSRDLSPRSPFAPKIDAHYDVDELRLNAHYDADELRSKESLGSNDEFQVDCVSRSSSGLFNLDDYWEGQGVVLYFLMSRVRGYKVL
jgi:hypothetical protein